MKTRFLAALLAAALTFSLTACNKEVGGNVDIPANQNGSNNFQKNMHQSKYTHIGDMCETGAGVYFNLDGFLYYLEKASARVTVLCGKPDCEHKGSDCNARINSRGMWYGGDKLYCVSYAKGNGGKFVTSMEPDGTGRQNVQELLYEANGVQSSVTAAIYYGGDVYYIYNDVLYRVPLGGDKEDAAALWGEEAGGTTGGTINLTGNELHFTLWADGDYVYFMVNLEQSDGTYRDTLFAYDINDGAVGKVWQVPDEAEVGAWDTAGVSVSSWYVLDGYIYFYLAGNGFWRSSLAGGVAELLASTGGKAEYGTAIFSDGHMCLLNDRPGERNENEGGDAFVVYGLDGSLQKELTLTALFDEVNGITGFSPLFISGNEIYFVADAGVWGDIVNGVQYEDEKDILCSVNIDTGEITQIYNWQ